MAHLVYACRFEVPAEEGQEEVVSTYGEWLADHYRRRRGIPDFSLALMYPGEADNLPPSHSLSSIVYEADGRKVVRIRWSFPDDTDTGLRWSNDIRVGQFEDRCSVEHLISIESVEYNVAPARLLFGSPRVVREICARTPTFVGEMQIKAVPYDLQKGGLGDFLALLDSELRTLPVVLLSPYARGEPNLINADQLARNLAGVAVVVRVEDPEITWDLSDEVGRQLSCFNGAARIYWPGFSKKSDPRAHRLFLSSWIEKVSPSVAARTIERAVFAVASFRFVPDRNIAELIRKVEAAERQKLLIERKASGDEFWADYERDLVRLDEAQIRIQELEAENANIKANQAVLLSGLPMSEDIDETPEDDVLSFSSVFDAVETAAKRSDNVEVLDSAFAAAADSPFQRPFDIYKALTDLNEVADVWRKNRDERGNGGDLLQHLRDRGWGKRSSMHISDTTRARYRAHYEFVYQGRRQLFEPHITIGAGDPNSCASIHFLFDPDREMIIVGHAGKHLPNTKT